MTSQTISTASPTASLAFYATETFATPGTYSVQLTIVDLANGVSTTVPGLNDTPITVTIVQFIATTTTASAPGEVYDGNPYALATATVVGADQKTVTSPAATYTFYNGTDTTLSSPLPSAPTAPGRYLVVATFAGSSVYGASTSLPFAFTISSATTAATGSDSGATINFGQSDTFTATIKAGSLSAVGTVDFFDNTTSTDLGTTTLNASGVAMLTTSVPLPAGTQSITMSYAGGAGFTASTATVNVVVLPSIYVLNATASGALSLSGSSTITVPGLVQVDSSSSSAIVESGATRTSASAIRVVGGVSVSGSAKFGTAPATRAASVADPLASLPIPSAMGLNSYGAINLGGVSSRTINPGIYTAINVTASATLRMNPGVYVITGGGFSVNGAASVSGAGVMIYNAGSNYNGGTPGTYGGFTISGSGAVNLSPPTTGPYAGILLFQSRDNTRAIALSGAAVANIDGGVVYAPAALLNLSGSAQLGASNQPASPLIVNQLVCTGSGTSDLTDGGDGSTADVAGQLLAGDVSIYVDDSSGAFTADELARIQDAVNSADATVAPYGVGVYEVSDPSLATTIITIDPTSPAGSADDGVLGCETPGSITLLTGWNWYTRSDASQVGADQYDFETIVLHEIGHSLGLGHSQDATSVMFATLETGQAKRSLATADLDIPDSDDGPCGLHAAGGAGLVLARSTGPGVAPTDFAGGEAPPAIDLPAHGNAGPAWKARRVAPTPQPASAGAGVRIRQSTGRTTLHDLALDRWAGDEADGLDGLARGLIRKGVARAGAVGSPA
jgi:hypothetical protein